MTEFEEDNISEMDTDDDELLSEDEDVSKKVISHQQTWITMNHFFSVCRTIC